jgi:hypothetical protein
MLNAEVPVTVTGEEHHQGVLARYPDGSVTVELRWCRIHSGKHRGQNAVEIRLDGHRVGELTYLMSQRYGPLLDQVSARGGRPGAEAVIERGPRGVQVVLRLPREHNATAPLPQPVPVVPNPPVAFPVRAAARRSATRAWVWIGSAAAVLLLIGIIAGTTGNNGGTPSASNAANRETTTAQAIAPAQVETTTAEPVTTTTTPTTTTTQPTTTQPAAPPPAKTTTKRTTTRTATPPPTEQPPPSQGCDPNYTGCVPIASDVDCLGGSGNGPAYVKGPIMVIGKDIYGLDADHDGIACE